jgi:hypothetical protein
MLRKSIAALSVAMVALLFTSPTALATNEDNTNNTTYWETYFGGGTVCYIDDSSKGTVNGTTVTLKDGGWDYLIVKGGSEDTGDGPGNKVYSNPAKDTPYSAPKNNGGQTSDVSHWIVCGTPPPTDVCENLDGVQTEVPEGYTEKDGVCTPPPRDVCENIDGVQTEVPEGYTEDDGVCTPPTTDVCENLSGKQAETPEGWTNDDGYCFYEETVCWLMDSYDGGDDYPPAGAYETFPQTRVSCETEIPCGLWVQKDVYHIDSWTDDELYKSLGDVLEWVNGHPEDADIYKSHVFLYGGDCTTPPPYCLIDDVKYYEEDVLPDGYTWTDEGLCTPPVVEMCDNIDKSVEWAMENGYFYDEETGDCFKKVYVCKYVKTPGLPEVLQTGNNPIAVSVNALKDKDNPENVFTGEFPFTFADEQGKSIAFAWAVPGTPQDEEPGLEDCPQPEPVQVCINNALETITAAEYAADPEKYILYDRETCQPPVDVCPNIEGPQSEVPEGLLLYGEGSSTKCATPPSLEGTLFASQCVDDVPWIVYDVTLTDPDDVSTDDGTATFTFTAPGYPGETYVKTVDIGSGKFLWPGATATDDGDGTWTATGWPGWALIDGEWVSIGDDNYGWTRDGVSVTIEVNPEMTVSLTYPPPTALCVAGPPTEVDDELDAPPATPVEAEAQFAG